MGIRIVLEVIFAKLIVMCNVLRVNYMASKPYYLRILDGPTDQPKSTRANAGLWLLLPQWKISFIRCVFHEKAVTTA